jgi:hypothetical protein
MAAASTTRGLSPTDIEQLRVALDGGRKPKVVFTESAGQIAGQAGQVVELTDPTEAEEWIVVRFGRDELPFSPADLSVPVRGAAKTVPARAPAARRTTQAAAPVPEPEFVLDRTPPEPPAQSKGKTMPSTNGPSTNGPSTNGPSTNGPSTNGSNGHHPDEAAAVVRKAAKPAKPPASLVVTLSYAEREWTVSAMQGAKSLAKPYVIRPTEALRMVALIDVPGVHEAVEAIIASERAEAEGRAERLRSELAEIETRLAELNHS